MDIYSSIGRRCQHLRNKAEELRSAIIQWEPPVVINCSALNPKDDWKVPEEFPVNVHSSSRPALYYFRILPGPENVKVIESLEQFKLLKKRSCPKIDKKCDRETQFLYCGSVKKGLLGRLKQHAGYGHPQTYSLQLAYWASELDLQLEYHYAYLDKQYVHLTEELEACLSAELRPLVGKQQV